MPEDSEKQAARLDSSSGAGSNTGILASLPTFPPWTRAMPKNPQLAPNTTQHDSSTGKPTASENRAMSSTPDANGARVVDHSVSSTNRLSRRRYPRDCPPLIVQWYHAVDVPKRKPFAAATVPTAAVTTGSSTETSKPAPVPKKYIPFSEGDSRAIEAAFQRLAKADTEAGKKRLFSNASRAHVSEVASVDGANRTLDAQDEAPRLRVTVPVNEDFLFDVDVERRELAPAYWLGPVYDVRRGSWFYSESAGLRACEENLATQLEEGYLLKEPWRFVSSKTRSASQQPRGRAETIKSSDASGSSVRPQTSSGTPKESLDITTQSEASDKPGPIEPTVPPSPTTAAARTYRLFGNHSNSVVTYEDASTAYVVTDDLYSRMSGTVYERLGGGAHFAGVKVVRGYQAAVKQAAKSKEAAGKSGHTRSKSESAAKVIDRDITDVDAPEEKRPSAEKPAPKKESVRQVLERQMSNLVSGLDPAQEEEEVRKRDEQEMRDDYNDDDGNEQGREIEHLILVTHGIGQRLGLRLESLNFVHDINTLRKTMKAVYNESADLQALNSEQDVEIKNCRIQVLPICWRHLLDFPRRSLKHNRQEHDLGDADLAEDEQYPTLEDITVQGIPAIRNLITDLGLDILLFQSAVYKPWISRIVLNECNRIYKLFKERHPQFKGKVSLLGHSLGSAVMFDILCNQKAEQSSAFSFFKSKSTDKADKNLELDFDVEDFYAFGSPIGLFQMLKGRSIAARQTPNIKLAQTPFAGPAADPFASYFEVATSAPKCRQIYNIFHPSDPIAYRMEPLISHALSKVQPQPMPYTKRGIFGAPAAQGLTGIAARAGQSVTGLWSSFSSGIANNLLNRSLGLTSEDAARLANPLAPPRVQATDSSAVTTTTTAAAALTGTSAVGKAVSAPLSVEDAKRLVAQEAGPLEKGDAGEHPPTLLNVGLESLYSGFQKSQAGKQGAKQSQKQKDGSGDAASRDKAEEDKMLEREDGKIRALNGNGRVDYAIQEGAFDISLLASVASHLAYWADEDVSHFVISQLLSRNRVVKGTKRS